MIITGCPLFPWKLITYYSFYDIPWYLDRIRSFENKNVNTLGPIFVFGFEKNSIFA